MSTPKKVKIFQRIFTIGMINIRFISCQTREDTFIVFDVPEGEHEVSFVYYPDCVKYGVIISVSGIGLLVVSALVKKLYGRRKKKTESGPEEDDELMIEELISEINSK